MKVPAIFDSLLGERAVNQIESGQCIINWENELHKDKFNLYNKAGFVLKFLKRKEISEQRMQKCINSLKEQTLFLIEKGVLDKNDLDYFESWINELKIRIQ